MWLSLLQCKNTHCLLVLLKCFTGSHNAVVIIVWLLETASQVELTCVTREVAGSYNWVEEDFRTKLVAMSLSVKRGYLFFEVTEGQNWPVFLDHASERTQLFVPPRVQPQHDWCRGQEMIIASGSPQLDLFVQGQSHHYRLDLDLKLKISNFTRWFEPATNAPPWDKQSYH